MAKQVPEAATIEELDPAILDPDERARLIEQAVHARVYRLAGRRIAIAGNDAEMLDRFDVLFGPLREPGTAAAEPVVFFHLDRSAKNPQLTAFSDQEAFRISDVQVIRWPFVILGRLAIGCVPTHVFIHAGAVVRKGKAVLLTGGSGLGKTTLVAHLVRRGAGFLSDELAPVHLHTRMVEPHPLRLGLRPGPAQAMANDENSTAFSMMGDAKRLMDPAGWSGWTPAPLGAVFVLSRNDTQEVATLRRPGGPVLLAFTVWTAGMTARLEQAFGLRVEEARPGAAYTEVILEWPEPLAHLPRLRAWAKEQGSLLAFVQYEDVAKPDFSAEPQITPLSTTNGVLEVVKRIPTASRNRVLNEVYGGRIATMVLGLTRLFADIPFFRLRPGRLEETLALVERHSGGA